MESSIFEQVNFPYYWGTVLGGLIDARRRQIAFCYAHPDAHEWDKEMPKFIGDLYGKRSPYRKLNEVLLRLRAKLGADYKNSCAWRKWMEDFDTMILHFPFEDYNPGSDLTCIRLAHQLC